MVDSCLLVHTSLSQLWQVGAASFLTTCSVFAIHQACDQVAALVLQRYRVTPLSGAILTSLTHFLFWPPCSSHGLRCIYVPPGRPWSERKDSPRKCFCATFLILSLSSSTSFLLSFGNTRIISNPRQQPCASPKVSREKDSIEARKDGRKMSSNS